MKKNYIYIANWKSYLTLQESMAWFKEHHEQLTNLAATKTIIICPDFLTLGALIHNFMAHYHLGAQNCSAYELGSYTGEIPARSLASSHIKYCIIGHSERRMLFRETIEEIAHKLNLLVQSNITPILCVSDEYNQELDTIIPILKTIKSISHIMIAYEPFLSIGTGIPATPQHIQTVLSALKEKLIPVLPTHSFSLLYGGSVNSLTIKDLRLATLIDGFLIGKASTDFQELKKIVEYI